jgi:hypothetical protein
MFHQNTNLKQCAAVNFINGVNPSVPGACKNATGLTAAFTTDASLSTIAGSVASTASGSSVASATGTAASSASGSTTGSSTASATSATASKSASASPMTGYAAGAFFWGAMVAVGSVAVAFGL